jgi:hypothetical protein
MSEGREMSMLLGDPYRRQVHHRDLYSPRFAKLFDRPTGQC